jgi:hypothetical protein
MNGDTIFSIGLLKGQNNTEPEGPVLYLSKLRTIAQYEILIDSYAHPTIQ